MTPDAVQRQQADWVADAALDRKAEQLVALDVRELTSYTDTFLIATGRSDRHARSIADAIEEAARARGQKPLGIEGYEEGRWVLIDLGEIVVHVFQPEIRETYDFERLWSDAEPLDLPALASAQEAGAAEPHPAAERRRRGQRP